MIRVVLDTNVLVAGLIAPGSAPATLLSRWLEGRFELVVSDALLEELADVLARPKITRHVAPEAAEEVLGLLRSRGLMASVADDADVPDPDDAFIIGLVRASADVLVTGDRALFGLQGLTVVTARGFLEALDGETRGGAPR